MHSHTHMHMYLSVHTPHPYTHEHTCACTHTHTHTHTGAQKECVGIWGGGVGGRRQNLKLFVVLFVEASLCGSYEGMGRMRDVRRKKH